MVGWFEIPVTDMGRAKTFYDNVFNIEISIQDINGLKMGWFPLAPDKKGIAGSLVEHEQYVPSATNGAVLYFTCEDVAAVLAKVAAAGGNITQAKKQIGEGHGFMGVFLDSEGNRIALHSQD